MTIYYYARVSTDEQEVSLQLDDAKKNGINNEYIIQEYGSGKEIDNRPKFIELISKLQPGDTLLFWKLDRISRSVKDLTNILHDLSARNILYRCTTQPVIDSTKGDYMSKFMVGMLSIFAEFERNLISDRTKAGMAAAAAKGTKLGRPRNVNKKTLDWRLSQLKAS